MGGALQVIDVNALPVEIRRNLSELQSTGLAFAYKNFKVAGANIRTFQTGAVSRGTAIAGGPMRSLGANWGLFGALGVVSQSTQNQFRTDIQLRLEEPESGKKIFLEWSLPFAITVSIDPGESLTFFFAVGGLPTPLVKGDFRLAEWTPFVAKNEDTGQVIPLGPLPSLRPLWLIGPAALLIIGVIMLFIFGIIVQAFITEKTDSGAAHAIGFLLTGTFVAAFLYALRKADLKPRRKWEGELDHARALAARIKLGSEPVRLPSRWLGGDPSRSRQ